MAGPSAEKVRDGPGSKERSLDGSADVDGKDKPFPPDPPPRPPQRAGALVRDLWEWPLLP